MKQTGILFTLCLIQLAIPGILNAQKVFRVAYESQADITVFAVEYESQCDLKVYFVDYESQTDRDGLWYWVQYESQADVKIYFVEYESQADLKVYYVDYESQAGWKSHDKKHLLHGYR
ncbi:MAG: DUF6150 family protein [Bacteroidota bacterium]